MPLFKCHEQLIQLICIISIRETSRHCLGAFKTFSTFLAPSKMLYLSLYSHLFFFFLSFTSNYSVDNLDGWGTMLQAWKSRVRIPMRLLNLFNSFNLSSHSMALGFIQPLTDVSTKRSFWWAKRCRRGGPHCHLWADYVENVESWTSHILVGLHGLLRG
jgi:hypothetical protein